MGPLLLGAIMVGGALAAKGAGKAIASATPAARTERALLEVDKQRLANGNLGMSSAQKRSLMSEAREELTRRQAQNDATAAREAAAAGGFGRSGVADSARRNADAAIRATQAETTKQVNALSQDKAQRDYERIRAAIANRSAEVKQNVDDVTNAAVQAGMGGVAQGLGTRVGEAKGYGTSIAGADEKYGSSSTYSNSVR